MLSSSDVEAQQIPVEEGRVLSKSATMAEAIIDEPDRTVLLKRLRLADRKIEMMMNLTVEAKTLKLDVAEARAVLLTVMGQTESEEDERPLVQLAEQLKEQFTATNQLLKRKEKSDSQLSSAAVEVSRTPESDDGQKVKLIDHEISRLREENAMLRENMNQAIELQEKDKTELETRIGVLESEARILHQQLTEKSQHIDFLEGQLSMRKFELKDALEEKERYKESQQIVPVKRVLIPVPTLRVHIETEQLLPSLPSSPSLDGDGTISRMNATLRAKDLVIEKLNRRLKNVESNAALETTVRQLAHREAAFERESARLRREVETLEKKLENLSEKPVPLSELEVNTNIRKLSSVPSVSSSNQPGTPAGLKFLQTTILDYLTHQKRGQANMANALLPVLCSASGADSERCQEILQGQMPLPRLR